MSGSMGDPADTLEPQLILELDTPIKNNGQDIDQVVLREPLVIEVRQCDAQLRRGVNTETLRMRNIHLMAKVSGLPVTVIEQLPISVMNKGAAYLNAFLAAGQEIGMI